MSLNAVLNAVAGIAVACTAIPGIPAWAVTLIAAVATAAAKVAQSPVTKPEQK
jgi:hypothetical protein